MDDRVNWVFPELVDPRPDALPWRVITPIDERGGHTDRKSRTMGLANDERASFARVHELLHARYSPVNVPRAPFDPAFIQSVEDARLQLFAQRRGALPDVPRSLAEQVPALFSAGQYDPKATILRALSCAGTSLESYARFYVDGLPEPFAGIGRDAMDRARTLFARDRVAPFRLVLEEAQRLADLLRDAAGRELTRLAAARVAASLEQGEQGEQGERGKGPGYAAGRGVTGGSADYKTDDQRHDLRHRLMATEDAVRSIAAESTDPGDYPRAPLGEVDMLVAPADCESRFDTVRRAAYYATHRRNAADRAAMVAGMSSDRRRHGESRLLGNGGRSDCGNLYLQTPPLTVRQPTVWRRQSAEPRCATEGTMIRRPDRYAIDMAVFARRVKRRGAVVLLDQSGSMAVSPVDAERLSIAAGSGALVATYCGDSGTGVLRIVADGAMRAERHAFRAAAGGNVVDWAALVWLTRQMGARRIWVSDGGVTGIGDSGISGLRDACFDLARRFGIERYVTLRAAVRALRTGIRASVDD